MANYPYNYNPYIQDLQSMRDRIDNTMRQYQQQNQNIPQQPTNLTQNFQLAPQTNNSELQAKYVNNIDDVKNTFVINTGLFVNRDMTTLWVKNISGDIKTYSLTEIVQLDPKDTEIANLKNEIANMRVLLNQQISQSKVTDEPEIAPVKAEKKSK